MMDSSYKLFHLREKSRGYHLRGKVLPARCLSRVRHRTKWHGATCPQTGWYPIATGWPVGRNDLIVSYPHLSGRFDPVNDLFVEGHGFRGKNILPISLWSNGKLLKIPGYLLISYPV